MIHALGSKTFSTQEIRLMTHAVESTTVKKSYKNIFGLLPPATYQLRSPTSTQGPTSDVERSEPPVYQRSPTSTHGPTSDLKRSEPPFYQRCPTNTRRPQSGFERSESLVYHPSPTSIRSRTQQLTHAATRAGPHAGNSLSSHGGQGHTASYRYGTPGKYTRDQPKG